MVKHDTEKHMLRPAIIYLTRCTGLAPAVASSGSGHPGVATALGCVCAGWYRRSGLSLWFERRGLGLHWPLGLANYFLFAPAAGAK